MEIDVSAAVSFLATHGRVLDRRRLDLVLERDGSEGVLGALDAYRNPDGGFGWGLEPDFRAPESQPTAGMHALEVLAEVAPATSPHTGELCDWLERHTLADGGLPFALPVEDPAGCAPFWVDVDPTESALMMTAQVAANAHRVARHDPVVASHPWLTTATAHCVDAIRAIDAVPFAIELMFVLRFVDAAAIPERDELVEHLRQFVPPGGVLPVVGGSPGEALYALDLAPDADGPVRGLFPAEVVAADLERLAGLQQPDGGWIVDFAAYSPAAELEWRGYATVAAVKNLLSAA